MDEFVAEILRVIVAHLPAASGDVVRELLQKIDDAVNKAKPVAEPETPAEPSEPETPTVNVSPFSGS